MNEIFEKKSSVFRFYWYCSSSIWFTAKSITYCSTCLQVYNMTFWGMILPYVIKIWKITWYLAIFHMCNNRLAKNKDKPILQPEIVSRV